MVYLLILSVLIVISAVYVIAKYTSQSHYLSGERLHVRARLTKNADRHWHLKRFRYWLIYRKQRNYELSEFPEPAIVKLAKSHARLARAGILDKIAGIVKLPVELSLTPLSAPCRFLVKTAAFIILLGGLLNGGSAKVDNTEQGRLPKKEKGTFPPYSWDDFYGRSTRPNPHAVNISDCPLSIRFGGRAYAAVDCLSGSDVHTFHLRTDAHSNNAGHNNHSNTTSHGNTDPTHTNNPHSNTTPHTDSATDGTTHANGGTHSQFGP